MLTINDHRLERRHIRPVRYPVHLIGHKPTAPFRPTFCQGIAPCGQYRPDGIIHGNTGGNICELPVGLSGGVIASAHINATTDLNQNNPGLGLGCQLRPALAVEAGFFEDSYENTTIYGIGILSKDIGPLEVGAFAGIARYPDADINIALPNFNDWLPIAGLQAAYGPVLLRLMPQDGVVADAVVTLQFKVGF